MKRLLAVTATLSLFAAAGPALAAPKAVYAACKAPAGAIVVKPGGKTYSGVTATPVGALNEGSEEAGTFYVDLAGKPDTSGGKLTLTLSFDNPAADYDLIVGGTNELSSDNPETRVVKAKHCRPIAVEVAVFLGAPIDELTLAAKAS